MRLKTGQAREETARLVFQEAKLRLGITDSDLEDPEPVGSCSLGVSGLSSAAQVSDLRSAFSEHRKIEKIFLRKLQNNIEEGEDEKEEKVGDNSEVKNVVTELFDEVLQQKRNNPANPRQELTNILQDSIKDSALRNCLTSIISPVEDDEYDTLDREPQPGHDSEIDSYLGEDHPGEFDDFFG